MKISRDVVMDLLPAYFSGEASADTRALVEDFLKQQPEFAGRVREDWTAAQAAPVTLTPNAEMAALSRTKRLLGLRSLVLGFAMFFTGVPLAFKFGHNGAQWFWSDFPEGAIISGLLAAAFGVAFAVMNHRLRITAL
jgi:hypothetical protein